MIGLIKALGVVKTAAAVTALTAATALGAQAVLPTASDQGQAHASAAAANAQNANANDTSAGKDIAAIQARLAANEARLLDTLNKVLAKLQANPNANEHAIAALQKVIAQIQNGGVGLNRASDVVGNGAAAGPAAPTQAKDHPDANNHPGPDNHPGKP
jgi:hypothetical protein